MRHARKQDKSVAYWAALTTFLANLAALNLIAIIGRDAAGWRAIAAFFTAAITAGTVYSKMRWDAAKGNSGQPPTDTTNTTGK
jgi:transposase